MQFKVFFIALVFSLASAGHGNPYEEILLREKSRSMQSHVDEGAVWNFGYMVSCATNSYGVQFNGYGCFCGIGGSGTAVDSLDSCCEVHDNCYGDLIKDGGPCSSDTNVYTLTYTYSCTAPWSWLYYSAQLEITCDSVANTKCAQALCECDKVASLCFKDTDYNDAYANYDKANKC